MNDITQTRKALRFNAALRLKTPLQIKSGRTGDFTDSTIERTPDEQLHINGYVWASLLRRCLGRIKSGQPLAIRIGKFAEDKAELSPLWCEPSFVGGALSAVNPGIRISRKWGAAEAQALYSDELIIPGIDIDLSFVWLCGPGDDPELLADRFAEAMWVINQGIETIGGGWSYGFGRLAVERVRWQVLDLSQHEGRRALWQPKLDFWQQDSPLSDAVPSEPEVIVPWTRLSVSARVLPGQLLAIHTKVPPLQLPACSKLPDTFVLRRTVINSGNEAASECIVTGKAFRQAVLSTSLERKFRSRGHEVCLDPPKNGKGKTAEKPSCDCPRCRWFGNTSGGGIISVADAIVQNPETVVLSRVQLCEHSMQNMNLFDGEYLKRGQFDLEIMIDHSRSKCHSGVLLQEVRALLDEMTPNGTAPPGWYRLGATTTATGQIEVMIYSEQTFGGGPHE